MKKLNLILNARWLMAVIAMVTIGVGQMWADTQTYNLVAQGDLASLSSSDKVLIVCYDGSSTYYALKNELKSSNANLATTTVTITSNTITADLEDNYTWNLEYIGNTTLGGNNYPTFYIKSTLGNGWLQNSGNTGSMVYTKDATDGRNIWVIGYQGSYTNKNGTYYVTGLYNSTIERMLAQYDGSSWRCYANSNWNNIDGRVVQIYKMQPASCTVTYQANGATSGSVPTDATAYSSGQSVTVKANTGDLARTGCTFAGWNTAADGSGTTYPADGSGSFTITANTTLYAKWAATVTWNDNGGVIRTDNIFVPAAGKSVTPPSDPSTSARGNCGDKFMGWTTTENYKGDTPPGVLVNGAQTVTGTTTYYAVFADYAE